MRSIDEIAREVLQCALAWDSKACLLGNVTAEEMSMLTMHILTGKVIGGGPKVYRKPWEDFMESIGVGYIKCTCGLVLQSYQQTREHWQMGHFDEVINETVPSKDK